MIQEIGKYTTVDSLNTLLYISTSQEMSIIHYILHPSNKYGTGQLDVQWSVGKQLNVSLTLYTCKFVQVCEKWTFPGRDDQNDKCAVDAFFFVTEDENNAARIQSVETLYQCLHPDK